MADIKLGKKDAGQADPSHVKGVNAGNSKGNYEKQVGHKPDGRATAERSTGISAKKRNPIDPRMPNIAPG